MRIAHILRKYNPAEWGGTETAVLRLLDGLAQQGAESVVFAPALPKAPETDPIRKAGHEVKRYKAFVPALGVGQEQRNQLVAVGGNLMSFELPRVLWREPDLRIIHTHVLNRIGGIALWASRLRRIPLVATIHGGVLDLPAQVKEMLVKPLEGGLEWGKIFGVLLRSRKVLGLADAVVTCNKKEAVLLQEQYPHQRVLVQPHSVPAAVYGKDCRARALEAFPFLAGQQALVVVGRLDPVKNQGWLVTRMPEILARHEKAILVLAGACTDEAYGKILTKEIRNLGLEKKVFLTGGLPPNDPTLVGLMQQAALIILPSLSETFGLVILEAWAAGRPVLASRTSGALEMIEPGRNGWMFELEHPQTFHQALDQALSDPQLAAAYAQAGRESVLAHYDAAVCAKKVRELYEELIEGKRHAIRHHSR